MMTQKGRIKRRNDLESRPGARVESTEEVLPGKEKTRGWVANSHNGTLRECSEAARVYDL